MANATKEELEVRERLQARMNLLEAANYKGMVSGEDLEELNRLKDNFEGEVKKKLSFPTMFVIEEYSEVSHFKLEIGCSVVLGQWKVCGVVKTLRSAVLIVRNAGEVESKLSGSGKMPAKRYNEIPVCPERETMPSLESFNFSRRIMNCFEWEKIATVEDLLIRTEEEMLSIPNFGLKGLQDVKDALKCIGLCLKKS